MDASPLLRGGDTDTQLDRVTRFLFSDTAIDFLNKDVYKPLQMNNWSFFHVAWGVVWGLANVSSSSSLFSLLNLVLVHSAFEAWEVWAGGYLDGTHKLDFREWTDIVVDTALSVLGFLLVMLVFLPTRPLRRTNQ